MKMKMECSLLRLWHSQYTSPATAFRLRFLSLAFTISIACLPTSSPASPGFTCGKEDFPYPFGEVNSGCGDPSLQLECDHQLNQSVIKIGDNRYYLSWDRPDLWDEHHLKIIEKSLWKEGICNPLVRKHTTEILSNESSRFRITDAYRNLTLWEGCSHDTDEKLMSSLPCNRSWYFNSTERSNFRGVCKSEVTIPVSVVNLKVPAWQDFQDGRGLLIKWMPNDTCKHCELTGGFSAFHINSMEIYCARINGKSQTLKIGLAIGGAGLAAAAVLLFIYNGKRRNTSTTLRVASGFSHYQETDIEKGQKGYMLGSLSIFTYQELQRATNFFDEKSELGDGGFGAVYLGKLEDGRTVAVKRLYQDNSRRFEQFINEVQILSSLYHPNLVRLYGCTSPESPILLLVYEYVPNGTLADGNVYTATKMHLLTKERT